MKTTRQYIGKILKIGNGDGPNGGDGADCLTISEPNGQGYLECLPLEAGIPAGHPENQSASESYLKAGEAFVNLNHIRMFHYSDLIETDRCVPRDDLKFILERRIASKVKDYFDLVHRPALNQPFIPGTSRINYGGRVFDERELIRATEACLEFYLTAGRFDREFSRNFGEMLSEGTDTRMKVLTVNSGSSANLMAISSLTSPRLGALRLKEGDEVITTACGFPTTIAPIVQNRLVPSFVDVDVDSLNVDPDGLEQAITRRTRAIMLAHTLGIPFDLNRILEIAEKHQLWVIEDNCDALGSTCRLDREFTLIKDHTVGGRRKTGTFGHIGTSSFYPAHQMTMGEGGAVYTSDPDLYRNLLSMRDWGRDCHCTPGSDNTCKNRFNSQHGLMPAGYDHKYIYSHLGYNLKITDIQAAIGLAQLDKLARFSSERFNNWNLLREGLQPLQSVFRLPSCPANAVPSPFGFALTVRDGSHFSRDDITLFLESHQIQTRTVFAGNMLRQPALVAGDFPLRVLDGPVIRSNELTTTVIERLTHTEKVMKDTFWIGVYPGLKRSMLNFIIEKIFEFVQR